MVRTRTDPLIIENVLSSIKSIMYELFPSCSPNSSGRSIYTRERKTSATCKRFHELSTPEEMPEYFDEFEKMLFHLPLIGTVVKKLLR